MELYRQYAQDVISGKVVTGKYIRLAAKRFFAFMEDDRYEFREKSVSRVIEFISILTHYVGKHAGKKFILEPWQAFIIASIYGFYVREDGSRLIQYVYIEEARKNGKSALAAALCLYHLIADGESGAEVYLAANSRDQVKLSSWPLCSNFAKGIDPNGELLDVFRDTVRYDSVQSWLKVLAADSTKLDGPNPSMFLLDEYHAARSGGLKDVLQSGQGMRDNPMAVIITTAGFDKLGPCYQYRIMCTEVLNGLKTDDSLFAAIYSIDEADDWKDENVWIKSNPNLGVTVKLSYLRRQAVKAVNSPSEEVGIKTKNFNMWCDSSSVWIPEHYILSVSRNINLTISRTGAAMPALTFPARAT
ncbi:Phage terminase-like protein, large subunit [Bacteroidales bacterium Barb6XT]|nr:Phage terminase-like protein, large subunit [Bacteroidales bacterium Barb6XT]OAV70054.1 Phage terminase-like protein, large subunit [Bacteroidales bacterium Barb6XT]